MGGTSADVASIIDGKITWTTEGDIDSLPLSLPMIEIVTIGAGGGSIASIDPGGALNVGPASAAAVPGPVCYGRGGKNVTVTDANLLVGIIDPDHFLGGKYSLHLDATNKIARSFSKQLRTNIGEMAEGVRGVVEANMQRAISRVTVEKGLEPREFSLVAFGGAGPIHATALARELKIPRVIVPPSPGTFSAYGLLISDIKLDHSRTYLTDFLDRGAGRKIRAILNEQKELSMRSLKAQRVPENNAIIQTSLDLRYKGQSYEVNVPYLQSMNETLDEFHKLHGIRYGYSVEEADVELVNVRTSISASRGIERRKRKEEIGKRIVEKRTVGRGRGKKKIESEKTKNVLLDGKTYRTPLLDRSKLGAGWEITGPAIVYDHGSTTLILPGMQSEVDEWRNQDRNRSCHPGGDQERPDFDTGRNGSGPETHSLFR
jgi:N-methylhydantoinase A